MFPAVLPMPLKCGLMDKSNQSDRKRVVIAVQMILKSLENQILSLSKMEIETERWPLVSTQL